MPARVNRRVFLGMSAAAAMPCSAGTAAGYRGIWYSNQPSGDQFRYKYSGGMATYPQQHSPIAIYSKAVNKTFFCYGGTVPGSHKQLVHMVSYFDHQSGKVPRPTILLDKQTSDAHDNPTLLIDSNGYLWIFSSAHGKMRPAYISRSQKPYAIEAFDQALETNFSYPQPWFLGEKGMLFLHTRYATDNAGQDGRRELYWMNSADGRSWTEPQLLASVLRGHYQISWPRADGVVGTAFNVHPPPLGLNQRTNLYYLETHDAGKTWMTVSGQRIRTPIDSVENPALVHDYAADGLLVYLKDIQYDAAGRPVILYLTTRGHRSGPENGPRMWHTAHWTGERWRIRRAVTSDHNYDYGSLYIESKQRWTLIAPTEPGPQPHGTGGEVALWRSSTEGESWEHVKVLTKNSPRNHTYVRRPLHAHPDFYAFWADGNPFEPSESNLYFTDREGSRVWRLPPEMGSPFAAPEPA